MTVPDDQDYAALDRLLAEPESWTPLQAHTARVLLANQEDALASAHPKDRGRRAGMQGVADRLRAAIEAHERAVG